MPLHPDDCRCSRCVHPADRRGCTRSALVLVAATLILWLLLAAIVGLIQR
ncbi:hypothetical protein [Sphingomonas profundi]|nr:hypothetical protein [Sphingomonas profundi]